MIVPATDVRLILTTVASRDEAEGIAHALVDEHLAACVNVIPGLASIYRWQGNVEEAEEILLLIKTTAIQLDQVEAALSRLHAYEVPEFLVLTPESAAKPYLDWLLQSSAPSRE
jgi:periplasmic divalent cation tolerance protein